jgi:urate oxidase
MAIVLGPNQYGKAEVRLVHVDRSTPVHKIKD